MKETPEMLHWLRERALPVEGYRKLPQAARKTIFPSAPWSTGTKRISTPATTRYARVPGRHE